MGAYEQVDQDVGWSVRTRRALRMDVPSNLSICTNAFTEHTFCHSRVHRRSLTCTSVIEILVATKRKPA
jgi:hypothetical protein